MAGKLFSGRTNVPKFLQRYESIGRDAKLRGHYVSSLNFYTAMLAEYSEHSDIPSRALSKGEFYYTAESVVTKVGIKKPFIIRQLPYKIARGFISDLRVAVDNEVVNFDMRSNTSSNVSVSLVLDAKYYQMNLQSYKVKGVWQSFIKQYKKVERDMQNRDIGDALKSGRYSDNVIRKINSFLLIREAAEEQHAAFYKTRISLELISKSSSPKVALDALQEGEKGLRGFCIQYDIKLKRLFLNAHEYQKSFTPSSSSDNTTLLQRNKGDIFPDDTLSSFTIPSHGMVGDPDGIPIGIDYYSGSLITIDFIRNMNAKNILVTAATGEGKSHLMKMLYTFFLPDINYDTIAFDFEGTEYTALGYVGNANVIGIGGSSGSYVNTMVIADPIGLAELDAEAKKNAFEMTERIFDVLASGSEVGSEGMSGPQRAIFSDMMSVAYSNAGVGDDPNTWKFSKSLNYFLLYDTLRNFIVDSNPTARENHGMEALKDFRNVLKPYFEEGSIHQDWFANPIPLTDFMENRHNIFNFAQGGKANDNTKTNKSLVLRQLYAFHLTLMKAARNRARNILTVVFIEELQRYLDMPYTATMLKTFTTGGRKLGMINFLITNDPSDLVASADNDSMLVQKDVSGILDNISTELIGALEQSPMVTLIDNFGLENADGYLQKLVNIRQNGVKSGGLKYCFFLNYAGKSTIITNPSHPALEDTQLYETNVNALNPTLRTAGQSTESGIQSTISTAFTENKDVADVDVNVRQFHNANNELISIQKSFIDQQPSRSSDAD